MMSKRLLLTTTAVFLLASGTSSAGLLVRSHESSRQTALLASAKGSTPQGIKAVVSANNRFAFDLYSVLRDSETGNIFYSPYSISAALAMNYEGASGKTAAEIQSVFHFPKTRVLRPNFAAIFNDLNKPNNSCTLRTGNALWVQKSFGLRSDYVNNIKRYYGGKAANVDFIRKTESSRKTINRYVAKQTNNKIPELFPEDSLDKTSRLVLTNAVYFKGSWHWEFDPLDTSQRDFYVTDSDIAKVPMMFMRSDEGFNYLDTGSLQVLELPYKGDKISMVLLLPHRDKGLESIESDLTASALNRYRARMKPARLDWIALPKFEFRSKYFLNDTLREMGMPSAFTPNADFSGMTRKDRLLISIVVHEAYVKVDEKGTEATAATGTGSNLTGLHPMTYFEADRPFVFLIQENKTGNILFLGRVSNPNSSG